MALKNHALDQLIIDAAKAEFLEHGFQKASLHKISNRAGTTTGALYTRYQNKDDLFCSLIEPALEEIAGHLAPIEALYLDVQRTRSAEALVQAIQAEEQIYMELLFRHYDECVLLFCKGEGSSIEKKMLQMTKEKARQTVAFFEKIAKKTIDFDGIEVLITEQMYYYRQILLHGYTKEKAVSCMKTIDIFLEAGWKAILEQIL